MVSSYYIIKLFQKATYERLSRDFDHENSNRTETNVSTSHRRGNPSSENPFICRICLEEGSIPIYGDDNTFTDLSAEVSLFGDIHLSRNDSLPQYLCNCCYKLLEAAILFRKTAKQSNETLQSAIVSTRGQNFSNEYTSQTGVTQIKDKKETLLSKYFEPIVTDNEGPKTVSNVKCLICSKILKKSNFKEHFSLHDKDKPGYICHVCGKLFRQRCAYTNHYQVHSKEFNYKCKSCSYRGRTSGLLNTHMKIHKREYNFMCAECPAKFLTKSNLCKHLLTHKQPTLKCDACDRLFHTKLLVEQHFKAEHLGIKNHICNICGKAFGYRKAMMRHQIDVHNRERMQSGRQPDYLVAEQKMLEEQGPCV